MKKERLRTILKQIESSQTIEPGLLKDLTYQEKELVENLYEKGLVKSYLEATKSLNVDEEWLKFKEGLDHKQTPIVPLWKNVLRYAAAVVILLTAAFLVQSPPTIVEQGQQIIDGEVITLRRDNQDVQIIDEDGNGQLRSASGEVIAEQDGNRLKYLSEYKLDTIVYNELSIPYGQVFELELSDGTLIHLNSGTTIKYPIQFIEGNKREVYIEGEGFFNVAKDKAHPFLVHSDAVTVEVLGTEFNVSSYPENPEIQTVLVEGAVAMRNSKTDDGDMILKPGTKGSWNKATLSSDISEVDIELYTSWIGGELVFQDTPFKEILVMLERRYNVQIKNMNPDLDHKKLNARFSVQIETIEDVLKSMRNILSYDYQIKGKEILIN